MAKQKGRNYTTLKKEKGERYEEYATSIAKRYANTDGSYSSTFFTETEGINTDCFYYILRDSVVYNWVSDKEVDKMEKKAISNQRRHAEEAGNSSRVYYAKLRKKRKEYFFKMLETYSNEEIGELLDKFADSTDLTKAEFAAIHRLTIKELDALLKKGFEENIASDDTCKKIEERSRKNSNNKYIDEFFAVLWRRRKRNQEEKS